MIKLYGGDCLDVTPKFPSNHFYTLIVDPPYGLGFLGKDWDKGIPGVHEHRKGLCSNREKTCLL